MPKEPPVAASSPDSAHIHPAEGRISILLIDEQSSVAESLRLAIAGQEISFHFCADAAQAIAMANQHQPTVILQHLPRPAEDGLALIAEFRANPATKDTPIIVLSGVDDPEVRGRAFEKGANDYLVKLPDKTELLARIRY